MSPIEPTSSEKKKTIVVAGSDQSMQESHFSDDDCLEDDIAVNVLNKVKFNKGEDGIMTVDQDDYNRRMHDIRQGVPLPSKAKPVDLQFKPERGHRLLGQYLQLQTVHQA
jgi:hypothetical protein